MMGLEGVVISGWEGPGKVSLGRLWAAQSCLKSREGRSPSFLSKTLCGEQQSEVKGDSYVHSPIKVTELDR